MRGSRAMQIAIAIMLVAVTGLGAYLYVLKRREQEQAQRFIDTAPVAPPVAGPRERVPIYVAYDFEGVVRRREHEVTLPAERTQRTREILRALLAEYAARPSPHELAAGSDVRDVYLVGGNLAVIDTTAAFANGHRSGIFVETLTVASLVETVAANLPGVTRVKILVEGRERETLAGHADLASSYDVEAVREFVKRLE